MQNNQNIDESPAEVKGPSIEQQIRRRIIDIYVENLETQEKKKRGTIRREGMDNGSYSVQPWFVTLCRCVAGKLGHKENLGRFATSRQASKYRRGKGIVYQNRKLCNAEAQ